METHGHAVAKVDSLDYEPFVSFVDARREVLEAERSDRVRLWLKYQIQEPRFDNPDYLMPTLGLSENEALEIADFLIGYEADDGKGVISKIKALTPTRMRDLLITGFTIGFFCGGVMIILFASRILSWYPRRTREDT